MATLTAPNELRQPVRGLPDPGEKVPALAWPTVALYVGTLALFTAEMFGILASGWSPWVTIPMGAAVTFLMFSVLHESTHHAVSTNTPLNNAFGYLSIPWVTPYTTYPVVKFIHIEHHRNTNEPKTIDPDAWCSEGPAWQFPLRWATIDLRYRCSTSARSPRARAARPSARCSRSAASPGSRSPATAPSCCWPSSSPSGSGSSCWPGGSTSCRTTG